MGNSQVPVVILWQASCVVWALETTAGVNAEHIYYGQRQLNSTVSKSLKRPCLCTGLQISTHSYCLCLPCASDNMFVCGHIICVSLECTLYT